MHKEDGAWVPDQLVCRKHHRQAHGAMRVRNELINRLVWRNNRELNCVATTS